MARLSFGYPINLALSAVSGPKTLLQIVAPTNQRVRVVRLNLNPLGSTPTSAQLDFDWVTQTDGGALTSDNAVRFKRPGDAGVETIQTSMLTFNAPGAEPAIASPAPQHDIIAIHQMASLYWEPNPDEPLIVRGGQRLGLRYLSGAITLTLKGMLYLEE